MKKLLKICKDKVVEFCKMLWSECKDIKTLILFVIVCVVMSLPIWAGYAVGFIFDLEWAFVASSVVWAFWMLPGAPFFAVSVAVTLAIKRIWTKRREKKERDNNK